MLHRTVMAVKWYYQAAWHYGCGLALPYPKVLHRG